MKAVILAAGMASRLRPLTDTMPKCLLKIGQRCLLQRTIDALIQNGINDFVVVIGYRGNQIKDFINNQYPNINIKFIDNTDYQTTNNIYSLWLAEPQAKGEEIILLDSDILFDPQLLDKIINCGAENALALNCHELGEEEMKVVVDNENNILEINKTCTPESAIGESVGIEKMSPQYTQALYRELEHMMNHENLRNVFYEKAFERLIAQGHTYKVIDTTNYFSIELDTVADFEQAKELIPQELY